MNIVILGPQGSGKGTQAKKLVEEFGFFYFESGAFLRKLAKTNKEIDLVINKEGRLLEDQEMFSLLKSHLNQENTYDNIMFDGYPRSIAQYHLLREFLQEHKSEVNLAILLDISEEETISRLSARRIDKNTGKIYNLITNPPPDNISEADLLQREDDQEEAIKTRLRAYSEVTEPLLEEFERDGILTRVDGERPIEVIYQDLKEIIKKIE